MTYFIQYIYLHCTITFLFIAKNNNKFICKKILHSHSAKYVLILKFIAKARILNRKKIHYYNISLELMLTNLEPFAEQTNYL